MAAWCDTTDTSLKFKNATVEVVEAAIQSRLEGQQEELALDALWGRLFQVMNSQPGRVVWISGRVDVRDGFQERGIVQYTVEWFGRNASEQVVVYNTDLLPIQGEPQ